MQPADESFEITCAPEAFDGVREALEGAGFTMEEAQISMVPQNTVKVTGGDAKNVLKLVDALEDHDDVQNVYSNFDIDESELEDA